MKALIYILSLVCAGTMLAQPNWDFSITDKSHNILIPADIEGSSFEMGDYIGVFYEENGELLCAGYSEYTEGNIALTAFGASFSYSGFTVGQAFHFIHWSATDQTQSELFAVYNSIDFPNGEQFVVDGLSGISSFSIEYIPGCTDEDYLEYDSNALQDDDSCLTLWSEAYSNTLSVLEAANTAAAIAATSAQVALDASNAATAEVQTALDTANDALAAAAVNVVDLETQLEAALANQEDGVSQADVDAAYADGVASVDITSDNQAVADEYYGLGYADGYNIGLIDGDDGIGQAQVDAAYADGAASVTPEDCVSQADLDAANDNLATTNDSLDSILNQYNSLQNNFSEIILSIDSIQLVYDSLLEEYNNIYIPNISEVNIPLSMPEGWSMFGYTCLESISVEDGFAGFLDQIILIKDDNGECCMPELGYDGIGDLEFSKGYKIKLSEEITDFQFCPIIIVD